jgi:hypothetical protein
LGAGKNNINYLTTLPGEKFTLDIKQQKIKGKKG